MDDEDVYKAYAKFDLQTKIIDLMKSGDPESYKLFCDEYAECRDEDGFVVDSRRALRLHADILEHLNKLT